METPDLAAPNPIAKNPNWRTEVPTVSQLTRRLRGHLENTFFDVWVRGEISGFRKPASGHAYLVLKDSGAQLRICLFRPVLSRIKFLIEDGMEVLIHGRITVYESRGEYQMVGDAVEPVGTGALQLAFEQLKTKLSAEGLFEASHKKTLPLLPKCIGVITSPTGAVVHDILKVLARRFPDREVLLLPTSVQGDRAAGEIVKALSLVPKWNASHPDRAIEVLIVGRGGGSLEDLWPFNEEAVARALYDCQVPIISAVGHETDFTIADFVADLRAPTPSAAAEMVLPQKSELVFQIQTLERRLSGCLTRRLDQLRLHLSHLSRRLISPQQRLVQARQNLARLQSAMQTAFRNLLQVKKQTLGAKTGRLNALSPLQVLARGYSLTYSAEKKLVRSAASVTAGDMLVTQLADGEIHSTVV